MIINFNFKNAAKKENFIVKNKVLGRDFFVGCNPPFYLLKSRGNSILLEGDLYYFYDGKKTEYFSNKSEKFIINFLSKIIEKKGFNYCRDHLEGVYTTLIFNDKHFKLQADKLKQKEIFYFHDKKRLFAASELNKLTGRIGRLDYDQNVIALILSSQYQYSPSKQTIYKNIYSLSGNEYIKYSSAGFENGAVFEFKNIENYDENKLIEYTEILNRAILGRSNNVINIANSTGGWDSTYIITALVELLGKDKVVSSTFNHVLKNRKGWNIYEKTRAKKIAEHFKIRHIEIPIDYNSPRLADSLKELSPLMRSHNAYIGAMQHFSLYKNIRRLLGQKSGTIFTGEASDSLHNFGFSQYVGFFHESYDFKEYGDKMKNYLYSPVFFEKLKSGKFRDDMAFKIWKNIANCVEEPNNLGNRKDVLFKYLSSIVLGQYRIPFERILVTDNLTEVGRNKLIGILKNQYFMDVINNINKNNYYSGLLHLYKQFHLQGTTMKMIPITANYNGFKTAAPFLDVNLFEFLEKMPMSWGRGLEWKKTKYPLKIAAARNKNFPIDIVETGIHSYPTEVDPSLTDETYNFYFNSTATDYFKETLRGRKYKEILSREYFDLSHIDKLVDNFLNDKMDKVPDYYSLIRLINFIYIGWY